LLQGFFIYCSEIFQLHEHIPNNTIIFSLKIIDEYFIVNIKFLVQSGLLKLISNKYYIYRLIKYSFTHSFTFKKLKTMKKIIAMAFFAVLFVFNSCKKDDDDNNDYTCSACASTPAALAANDASSAGVYKGVLLGSTGTISISLFNGNTNATAVVVLDEQTVTLTSTDLAGWEPGQAVSNALFTGTINGQNVSAVFSVDANGQNPQVSVGYPGHAGIVVEIYKEFSTALVKSFEGTYSGGSSGGLNIVMRGNDYIVIIPNGVLVETTLVNGKVDFVSQNTTVDGDFVSSDHLKGTWSNTSNESGTWEARRTL
jgi:hypothetical protein